MKKFIVSIIALIVVLSGVIIAYLLFTGPRMYVQPYIRAFQAQMPSTPPGTIPVVNLFEPLPTKDEAKKLTNPVAKTSENYARGKIYYGYYCAFCHGDKGEGFGPVGYSYNPVPADLRTAKVQSMFDGELLYLMLTGIGHAPMLERIVLPEYRWYLVLYVRQLGSQSHPISTPILPASVPPK